MATDSHRPAAQIRRIREIEAQSVLALWNEAAEGRLEPAGAANILRHLQQSASHRQSFCLVAEVDGALQGFLTAVVQLHPTLPGASGEIEELYVRGAARRAGIATALVRQAVAQLLQHNDMGIIRAAVDVDSLEALGFWRGTSWQEEYATFSFYP